MTLRSRLNIKNLSIASITMYEFEFEEIFGNMSFYYISRFLELKNKYHFCLQDYKKNRLMVQHINDASKILKSFKEISIYTKQFKFRINKKDEEK